LKRATSSWKAKCLLGLLWINFVALWFRVYQTSTMGDVTDSVNYLGGLISAYGLLVTLWVLHNIRIYRKKGARKDVRVMPFLAAHDSLKRYMASKVDLKRGQEILVDVIGDRKVFLGGSRLPLSSVDDADWRRESG
jgi:hypothetical protein